MAHAPPTDEELAIRAAGRDANAFTELVKRYEGRLPGYLRSQSIPRDHAEDLAQDIWIKVWRALPKWKPTHFRGWLFTIARRAASDARPTLIRNARRVPLDQAQEPEATQEERDSGADPKVLDRLKRCLDALRTQKSEYHAVFVGHAGGRSYQELVDELLVEMGTIKSRLNRAREWLKKCLQPKRGEADDR